MLLVKYFAMCVENALGGLLRVDPRRDAEARATNRPTVSHLARDVDVRDRIVLVRGCGGEDLERRVEVGVGHGREPAAEVGCFHESGAAPGRHVVPRPAERASEARHRDVPLTAAGVGVSAHDADDGATDEVGGEGNVDGGVVERARDREVEAVAGPVEPVADRLVDGRPEGRAGGELVLGVEALPQRDERQRSGRVGDDHNGVDRTRRVSPPSAVHLVATSTKPSSGRLLR